MTRELGIGSIKYLNGDYADHYPKVWYPIPGHY
uniref:Uncharacterized protein n=1 Tax=Anguilla anguilla TaxID=7936 RepID=A0A0E9PNY5_ANGAN